MIDGSTVGSEPKPPIWPQDGAVAPLFESPETAAAFVAEAVGLTFDDLGFTATNGSSNPDFNRASAWFPGIPQTALFYTDPTKGTYKLTEGATGIVRRVRSGDFTPKQLVTPPVRLRRPGLFTIAPTTSSGAEGSSVDPEDESATLSVEQRLAKVAAFMHERGISAVLVQALISKVKQLLKILAISKKLSPPLTSQPIIFSFLGFCFLRHCIVLAIPPD